MWNFPVAPPKASTYATPHDYLFYAISALTVFFTVVVFAIVIFFAVKYREGSKASREGASDENLRVEIMWSVPPLFLAFLIFAWSTKLYVDWRKPPDNAMEIFVIGKQWMWHVQHPNGVRENNELHLPAGVPVRATMISQDVIHAFYIPAFRSQYHVVPGRYTVQYFTPTTPGRYPLYCTMHCGTQHSEMGGYVTVLSREEYAKWLARGGSKQAPVEKTMAQRGADLFKDKNCGSCHGAADTMQGPSLNGIYGTARKMTDGTAPIADQEYLREAIIDPYRRLNQGYRDTMPGDYRQILTEEQLLDVIEYIKSLGATKNPDVQVASNNSGASSR